MGKKIPDYVRQEAEYDLVDFLLRHGFDPENAIKTSRQFWDKHWKKIKDVY